MKRYLLLAPFIALTISSFAQMSGWSHTQPLTLTEHSGATIYNYQLRVTLDTQTPVTAGEMLAGGNDIRFSNSCTGGTVFPYWIESGMNTASTVIWVKIDSLQANSVRTIYLHYGNPAAPAVSSIPGVFIGPHSSTDSLSYTNAGGVTNSQRGFRFSPNEDLLVTAFGKFEPTGSTRYITLFQVSDQAILRQMQVSGPAAQYSYGDLTAPIWLTQGTQYLLEMYQGGSDGYYFGAGPQVGQHLTYHDMRYCNGCDQNTYPNNFLTGIQYGYPDCWYWTKTNVAVPPTYAWESFHFDLAAEYELCLGSSMMVQALPSGGAPPFTFSWTGPVDPPNSWMGTTSPADTTTYTVTGTDACGFSHTATFDINVKPVPENVVITSSAPLICNGEYAELSVPVTPDTYLWSNDSTTAAIIVMPSVTTTYSVDVTNVHGCTSTFSYEQEVNEPVLDTQAVTICANQFHTVGTHTYNQSGTYTDTIVGATNCDSIVTTNLTVLPLPEITDDVEICFGTTYTVGNSTYSAAGTYVDTIIANVCDAIVTTNLTIAPDIDAQAQAIGLTLVADLGGDSYQWVDCANGNTPIPGATSSFYEVTANGSYGVLVTVGNCTKLSNCIAITTVGMEENDLIENISVYPNPNSGSFSVQSSANQTVRIANALGQVIATADLVAGQSSQIDLEVNAGVYFVVSRTKVIRVVVE